VVPARQHRQIHMSTTLELDNRAAEPMIQLPNDIWDIIVKQSKRSNTDIVKSMSSDEFIDLQAIICERKIEEKEKATLEKDKARLVKAKADLKRIALNKLKKLEKLEKAELKKLEKTN
jgi:hypothetical protein